MGLGIISFLLFDCVSAERIQDVDPDPLTRFEESGEMMEFVDVGTITGRSLISLHALIQTGSSSPEQLQLTTRVEPRYSLAAGCELLCLSM